VDRFVVGTGRCGSTLLSSMLASNTAVASVFEWFTGLDMAKRLAPEPVDGAAFAALVAGEQSFVTQVLARGHRAPEIVYPFDRPGVRHRAGAPMPWLLVSALPRLFDDPDAACDDLLAFAAARPPATLAAHHRATFEWLAARAGRRLWIERSGSSIEYLGELVASFPTARFVHLHRDGREAALSMREHPFYRFAVSALFGWQPDPAETPHVPHEDFVGRVLAARPPASLFGAYWTQQLVRGYRALGALDRSQWLAVDFDELVADPKGVLERIGAFFELPDEPADWTARGAALLRGAPPLRADALPPDERAALDAACRAGMQLVGRLA
jgi:hypothetical protein